MEQKTKPEVEFHNQITDEYGNKKFNLITTIRDPRTGAVIAHHPYRCVISREHGELYERPPGSGHWFYPDGSVAKTPSKDQKQSDQYKVKTSSSQ